MPLSNTRHILYGINHQPHDCLLNRLFRRRSKKTQKLRITGLCEGNSPVTGGFPTQRASNAEKVSIGWRHHENKNSNISWYPYWKPIDSWNYFYGNVLSCISWYCITYRLVLKCLPSAKLDRSAYLLHLDMDINFPPLLGSERELHHKVMFFILCIYTHSRSWLNYSYAITQSNYINKSTYLQVGLMVC